MNTPVTFFQKYLLIGMLVLLMAAGVWVIGQALHEDDPDRAKTETGRMTTPPLKTTPLYQEAGVFQGRDQRSRFVDLRQAGTRRLAEYYDRRAYPGAPPYIPHPVESDMKTDFEACSSCHENGGFVPTFQAFAPVTPHAAYRNCRQCHVPQATETLLVANQWQTTAPPAIGRAALPGGPPPIPHGLHMRENCSACHAGPAAPVEIRTSHPERLSCRQCHVPAETALDFARPGEQP
ncbi:hypothetical protein [Acanthopleuribacter pedis]|uniref:Periplasmic nitrate reductase, electron transfer subunit n=1 Tax=Acanthopleuribacter pedis TaxID=442870 RepID=A0A8J7Q4U4_9BACT|nr:hypothetical protein [Acanthopleuribacter pedis]MBO1319080.1 hypothetical protein [Acanthopleuribacter pedis]